MWWPSPSNSLQSTPKDCCMKPHTRVNLCSTLQVLGEEWRAIALDYQEKVHHVAIIILKAIFIGLGRDERIIDEVRPLTGGTECMASSGYKTPTRICSAQGKKSQNLLLLALGDACMQSMLASEQPEPACVHWVPLKLRCV